MMVTEMILFYSEIKLKKNMIDGNEVTDSVSEIAHSGIKTGKLKYKYLIQEYKWRVLN